ncbi:slit homolog 2 protein [Patella vulgata]|uniref:slit homolog 2 protein n=1 Tax=Patella vulgata TaxID=6465 RepID=UPI00217F843F|nr:slit homolog 2 protein [Patella vulgata]
MVPVWILFLIYLKCVPAVPDCPDSCLCFSEFVTCTSVNEKTNFPTSTRTIVLDNAQLSSLPSGIFQDLPVLKLIEIRSSNIGTIESGAFSNLHNLDSILISSSTVGTIATTAFSNCSQIETIAISYCTVSAVQLGAFSNLKNLTRLEIYSSNISVIDQSAFQNISNIKSLDLFLNDIIDLKQGTFTRVVPVSANIYSNTFGRVECNTFEELFAVAERKQFYSNKFTCNCDIAWILRDGLYTHTLSNNECSDASPKSLRRKSLKEVLPSSKMANCVIPAVCRNNETLITPSTTQRSNTVSISSTTVITSAPDTIPVTITKSLGTTTTKRPSTNIRKDTTTADGLPSTKATPVSQSTDETFVTKRITTQSPRVTREMTKMPETTGEQAGQRNHSATLKQEFIFTALFAMLLMLG